MPKKYLVTPALPYANGAIHLGHMLEHIQVNIFVRALRMDSQDVLYVCGADSHGTPIEMNALKAGVPPAQFVADWQKHQANSFKDFGVEFDGGYGSTHTKENENHAGRIFSALKAHGYITTKTIEQLFDPELKRFLPDRMVRGTCPKCKAKDQYGDICEACGRTYQPTDLIEPKSALSGATPIMKESTHYFVSLKQFEGTLKDWVNQKETLHDDTRAFLSHWFKEGLKDWDISRDGPYFGFLIPGETDKYFYVWLDAPIGYISLSEKAALLRNRSFKDYWQDADTRIIHFIGKDIVYFHTLFWPAMLKAADYTLPYKVVVHGMLTVDGEKMSKSRGTFILADTFKQHVDSEALRYYFACKLSNRAEDIDLNFNDFLARVNTDLVNKVVNLISRALPLLHRLFEGKAGELDKASDLYDKAKKITTIARDFYAQNEPGRALHEIVRLSEDANRYLQEMAPWQLVKEDPARAHQVLTTGLYIGKVCLALLKPVLPNAVTMLEDMLNDGQEYDFSNVAAPFTVGQQLKPYEHLFKRVEQESINAMIEASKNNAPAAQEEPKKSELPDISIDQFMAIELRAAKVIAAAEVLGSDKLIACTLDLGPFGKRSVFSGLRPHVQPHELVDRMVVMVVNLAPRKMRFGISEGMILACGEDKPIPLFIDGAKPGDRVG
jgi:methionyl-tRNA synthetase